jgi:hypothetical protein
MYRFDLLRTISSVPIVWLHKLKIPYIIIASVSVFIQTYNIEEHFLFLVDYQR